MPHCHFSTTVRRASPVTSVVVHVKRNRLCAQRAWRAMSRKKTHVGFVNWGVRLALDFSIIAQHALEGTFLRAKFVPSAMSHAKRVKAVR